MEPIREAFAKAIHHHQAGRLQAAEQIYRQILQVDPRHADSHHLLGVVAHQTSKHEMAVQSIKRAIGFNPDRPVFHNNLGEAYRALKKFPEAIASYRRAIDLKPDYAEAYNCLGNACKEQGNLDEAIAWYQKAIGLKPDFAGAHYNLAGVLREQGRTDDAIASYRRAIEAKPDLMGAHVDLGNVYKQQGQPQKAIACYERAVQIQPNFAETHFNLGNVLREQGRLDEAIGCYQRAVRLKPDFAKAHNNLGLVFQDQARLAEAIVCYRRAISLRSDVGELHLNLGNALKERGQLDEAIDSYQQALRLKPDFASVHNNLGNAFKDRGDLDEAIASYRKALQFKPDFARAHSNLLYTLHFHPQYDARRLYDEHRVWNEQYAKPLASAAKPHVNDRSADRPLRVGYLSPDFRAHPVGRFLVPLLEAHDHNKFEIFGYSSVSNPDAITDRCCAAADIWRPVFGMTDEQIADAARDDQIDVLVDLTMHMGKHHLLAFARKPAPVQVTYLAYPGTTGMDAIDYRLTDPYLDPPDRDDSVYAEQSIRLPRTYWCYRPLTERPPVAPLPATEPGAVTFGCLNNFCKVTRPTLESWCKLLLELPKARLVLHAGAGSHRQRAWEFLAERGLAPERLLFVDKVPPDDYFRIYEQIDICLDPFPYGGGTTTCDALWMGVPVVSLVGQTAVGRGGLSILSNIGLPSLAAADAEQYIRMASVLANDLDKLAEVRKTLRQRMETSPLMNAADFARDVEAAYRTMWQRWLERSA